MKFDQIYKSAISHLLLKPEDVSHLDKGKLKCSRFHIDEHGEYSRAFHAAVFCISNGEKVSTLIAKLYGTKEGDLLKQLASQDYSEDQKTESFFCYHIALVAMFLEEG